MGLFDGWGSTPLPTASQAKGYGGAFFGSTDEADKSCLMSGIVTDPATGYVGTPAQIYDRYRADGRNTNDLVRRFHR